MLGGPSFLIGGFSRQEHGRDMVVVKVSVHEFRVLYRNAEAQPLHVINIGHIFQQRCHHMVGTAVGDGAADGIDTGQLPLVIAAGAPFQRVQVHRIGNAEILERAQELAVNGLRQTDLRRNAVTEIGQDTLAVHALRGGGQAQQYLRLIVG